MSAARTYTRHLVMKSPNISIPYTLTTAKNSCKTSNKNSILINQIHLRQKKFIKEHNGTKTKEFITSKELNQVCDQN